MRTGVLLWALAGVLWLATGTVAAATPTETTAPSLHERLFVAVQRGDLSMAQYLVDEGADVNYLGTPAGAAQDQKATMLHVAAYRGDGAMARLLLAAGANPAGRDPVFGTTPLHAAASRDVAEVLLAADAPLDAQDSKGQQPLHKTLKAGRFDVAAALVAAGAPLNAPDGSGWLPIYGGAVAPKDHPLYGEMIAQGAEVNLVAAAMAGDLTSVQRLFDPRRNLAPINEGDVTLLHVVASLGRMGVGQWLLSQGADPKAVTKSGNTPLHFSGTQLYPGSQALREAEGAAVAGLAAVLMDAGTPVNSTNENGETPLTVAACYGPKALVQTLLQRGADVFAANQLGQTALHQAVGCDNRPSVYLLISNGADPGATDKNGRTPLHYAAANRHLLLMTLLLSFGSDPSLKDGGGVPALPFGPRTTAEVWCSLDPVCQHHFPGVQERLSQLPAQRERDEAFLQAVQTLLNNDTPENMAAVQKALHDGAHLHTRTGGGRTALHLAAEKGHTALAALLLHEGAFPNMGDDQGRRPLHLVRNTDVATLLLEHGGKPGAPDKNGVTPRALAKNIPALLTLYGGGVPPVVSTPPPARTPVTAAPPPPAPPPVTVVLNSHTEAVFEAPPPPAPAAPVTVTFSARTPVSFTTPQPPEPAKPPDEPTSPATAPAAATPSIREIDEVLLDAITIRDVKNTRKLLFYGADPNATGPQGRSALHLAVMEGEEQLVAALVEKGADVNRATPQGWTALHTAAAAGAYGLVEQLLAAGADPNRRTADGATPRDLALARNDRHIAHLLKLNGGN